ncbi:hypothetical protein B5M42_021695 [Paenibacillus athensensis]|nr:hypothetical protein [Paenibacillus athensensis]MCD1261419.1 hypothetical protein [Paenibacillus athensensis]
MLNDVLRPGGDVLLAGCVFVASDAVVAQPLIQPSGHGLSGQLVQRLAV